MKKDKISTMQLAKICGVSQGTVDRALNNRPGIRPETKEKILAAAKEYGYRPNIHARSMAGGKTMLIGVVVFDLKNQYFADILIGIENHCNKKGYSTVVMFTDKDPKREIECIKNLYYMSVDGIVICPINKGGEYENFLQSLNMLIVTIGNRLEQFPFAGINDALAMRECVEYVLSKGYERLIYVKPDWKEHNAYAQNERLRTFREICSARCTDYTITNLTGAENALDGTKKNAYICPTDIYAIRLLAMARDKKAGVIGFDNIRLIDELDLGLDSVAYDVAMTAAMVADYIIEDKNIVGPVAHQLVKRGSI